MACAFGTRNEISFENCSCQLVQLKFTAHAKTDFILANQGHWILDKPYNEQKSPHWTRKSSQQKEIGFKYPQNWVKMMVNQIKLHLNLKLLFKVAAESHNWFP